MGEVDAIAEPADAWELLVRLGLVIRRVSHAIREKAGVNQLSFSHIAVVMELLERLV